LKTSEEIKKVLFELNKFTKLFIISSGGTRNISRYLENNGLLGTFTEILGADSHTRSKVYRFNLIFEKYSFLPGECIFVTDTLGDILEANKVNVKTIAVDFGYHTKETLEEGKPFKIVSSFNAILETIKELSI
jgi:phosphoglycolate phosphatase